MTSKKINKAIAFLGLHVIRARAYSYFHDAEGNQIGESVWVYRLNHYAIEQWVEVARSRWEHHHATTTVFRLETVRRMLALTGDGPEAVRFLATASAANADPTALWETAHKLAKRPVPVPMENAPSGFTPTRAPRPVKTLAEYEAGIAAQRTRRRLLEVSSDKEREALEWLALCAVDYGMAKAKRKSDPKTFRRESGYLSRAASAYEKIINQDI